MTHHSPLLDEPYFLPYQLRWIADESDMKLYEKSRRIGITYATSYRAIRKCMMKRGFTQWVSSRDALTAREFITDYVARWAKALNVVARGLDGDAEVIDEKNGIQAYVARFEATGSRIISLSSTPEAFAGKGGDVLLDEVDLHEKPGKLIDMALPCTTWGGQLEVVSAYNADGSANSVFATLVKQAKAENPMGWSFHRTDIDDAVAEGFVEAVNKKTGRSQTRAEFIAKLRAKCRNEDAWRSQYKCLPPRDDGAMLSYELIAGCEAEDWAQWPPRTMAFLGMDVGRKHDLSVIWVLEQVGDVRWTRKVDEMEKTPYHLQLKHLLHVIEEGNIWRSCIDAQGIGSMLAEEAKRKGKGRQVEGVEITAPVKAALVMDMLTTFEQRLIRIPSSQIVREDFHKVEKETTVAGNVRYIAPRDADGHSDRFFACALALHAAKGSAGPTVWEGAAAEAVNSAAGDMRNPQHVDLLQAMIGAGGMGGL